MIRKSEVLGKVDKIAIPMDVDVEAAASSLGCDQERLLSYMIKLMAKTAGSCREQFKKIIEECDDGKET